MIARRPVGSCPGRPGPAARDAAAAAPVVRRLPVVLLAALVALLSACSADPIPAPAPAPPPPTTPVTTPSQVIAGVDEIGPGFNPHLRAHQSSVTTAIATLALPSVFRPDSRGALKLDPTVATSATVTSTNPFTVSYELNVAASWSSGAPIAAEDFVYLWQQMRTQPGTIGAAGYKEVTDVRSRAGGKAVDVVFDEPYPHWRELFSGLLPAHLLKDAPGGWTGPLINGVPASGGPFRVMSVDRVRGEILLNRSDPYWATPSKLDEIVLRRLDPSVLPTALANHDVDLALPQARPEIIRALATLDTPPTVARAPRPLVQQLALRTGGGPLADPRVRQGIAATLDRDAIRAAVAPQAVRVDAFGAAPSDAGYVASAPAGAPARPDSAAAAAAFGQAGYVRTGDGPWQLGGRPLNVVVGAAAERPEDIRVAQVVAAQLRAGGVTATVVAPPSAALFGQATVVPVAPTTTPTPAP
ncbi:MAG: ABC transporter substrate-binding protein, partial [Pseudonocardia sp.]|nr:ABC transporter substrate-binding protein [Pseudonocardia sp.]